MQYALRGLGFVPVMPQIHASEVGSATLNGTVTDPTGAAVVNAQVTATNTETGLVRN